MYGPAHDRPGDGGGSGFRDEEGSLRLSGQALPHGTPAVETGATLPSPGGGRREPAAEGDGFPGRDGRQQPEDAPLPGDDRERCRHPGHRPAAGRERHRQGVGRRSAACSQPPQGWTAGQGQLRSDPRESAGGGTLRLRKGGLHRRRPRPARLPGAGRRRHPLSR